MRGMIGSVGCLLLVIATVVLLLSQCVPVHAAGSCPTAASAATAKGIDLYVQGNDVADFNSTAAATISHAAGLGVNAIAIAFPIWMDGPNASTVLTHNPAGPARTPNTDELTFLINHAHAACMTVTLRPTIDETTLKGIWRGGIQPANIGQWFDSYKVMLAGLPVADALSIGVELESLEGQMYHWYDLIDWLRPQIGMEQLTYGQNHGAIGTRPEWFTKLDYVGVDFYFANYQLSGSPSELDMEQALANHDATWLAQKMGLPANRISIAEVGLSSYAGSYREPWGRKPDVISYAERDAYLTAVCHVLGSAGLYSLYFWNFSLYRDDVPGAFGLNDTSSEQVVASCYGSSPKVITA